MNKVDIEMMRLMRLVALEKEIQRENEFQLVKLSQKETDQVGGGYARCPPVVNW